jgi:3-dehydroquinate synthetase/shikimate kinase
VAGVAHDPQARARDSLATGTHTRRAVALIGFMGAGKSTLARKLAEELGVSAFDSDSLLEQRFGHSIAQEFEQRGESSFREAEESLVCELLAGAGAAAADAVPGPWTGVIALGGGSVLSAGVRAALARHLTIFVEIDPTLAWQRLQGAADRPLARDRDAFLALAADRQQLYEELADVFLPAPAEGVDAALDRGLAHSLSTLAAAPSGTRLVWASAASGCYPVLVGEGLFGAASDRATVAPPGDSPAAVQPSSQRRAPGVTDLAAIWPLDPARSRAFCVTDETVGSLHGASLEALGGLGAMVTIEPGEPHKTLAVAEHVWSTLAARGMTRADHVVALGGGVVGDLAGFCAATYQRGVAVVHVPTTLVAQVDSAYGGKTGVDLPDAKNYVGCYHQPAGVLTDPALLATLPRAELAAGWVEVLKTGLLAGGSLWQRVSGGLDVQGTVSHGPALVDEQTILECIRTKLAVVAADERDGGRRQILNLGHTVGHAIETATSYGRYRHGEAVGMGLLAALRLSGADSLRAQVRELLLARGLPVTLSATDTDVEAIVDATARDKKRLGEEDVPFVLLAHPGEPRTGCRVGADELRVAVQELFT